MKTTMRQGGRRPRKLFRELAETIARRFHPLRVILFGSHACGQPTRDSDVDLLVVMRQKVDPVRIRCALPHWIPMDVLVRTPAEIARRLAMGDSFISEILHRGQVLYDTRGKRVG